MRFRQPFSRFALGVAVCWIFSANCVRAQSVAAVMCESHGNYVVTAMTMLQQGHTLDTALRIVRSVWQREPRLANFLEASITLAYRDPNSIIDALQSGRWQRACVQHLMGG